MSNLDVNGVLVSFPFKPYDVQVQYMEKMIQCLQQGLNGVLESPTGTGKTLCLLCASLAWLESKKAASQAVHHMRNVDEDTKSSLSNLLSKAAGNEWDTPGNQPKVIYCSRTHSQLTQAMRELKRTSYKHMKASVIASRDQLCINPEVTKEQSSAIKRQLCASKVSSKTCHFYNNLQNKAPDLNSNNGNQVKDIEDLVAFGNKNKCCPYFAARELKNNADIIFMPYNYLLDPKARQRHGIDLKNSVVIFDEAHNIASVCENSASFQLKSQDLASAIAEVTQVMQGLSSMENMEQFTENEQVVPDFTLNDLALLKVLLCEFEQSIDAVNANQSTVTKDGQFLYDVLQKLQLTYDKKEVVLDLIDKVAMYLTTTRVNLFQRKEAALLRFAELVRVAYSRSLPESLTKNGYNAGHSKCFKVYLHPNTENKKPKKPSSWFTTADTSNQGQGWILDFWCFNPGLSMEDLIKQEVRSIILTSGTLTPLNSFTEELGIPFPVQLENPHVVGSNQIWSGVVHCGPDKVTLNSTYKNRSSESYLFSLGRSIVNICRIVPGGVLVFFPSYRVMEDSIQSWQSSDIWNQMNKTKKVFSEPRTQAALNTCMQLYYESIDEVDSKGAMFMAVCRGKVSEGLDFANNYGRAVIITGLPYPPLIDQRVCLKKKYLDEKCLGKKSLNGDYWYQMEATRAVNQAIGRVIRHSKDYGAVILCDERFNTPNRRSFLPSWLRKKVQSHKDFGTVIRTLVLFYRNLKGLSSPNPVLSACPPTIPESSNSIPSPLKRPKVDFISSYNSACENEPVNNSVFDGLYSQEGIEKFVPQHLDKKEVDNKPVLGRRKLKIVPNFHKPVLNASSSNQDTAKSQPSTSSSSSVTKKKLNVAKVYLTKVKSEISDKDFKFFTKVIQSYKTNACLNSLLSGLADLFVDNVSAHKLFREFVMLVKPEHKKQFTDVCVNMMGQKSTDNS